MKQNSPGRQTQPTREEVKKRPFGSFLIDFHDGSTTIDPVRGAPLNAFTYSFPAIRGVQAGREYYVAMCPLKLVPTMFRLHDEEVPAALRAQRTLNKGRLPQLTEYLIRNSDNYVFGSLVASIDGEVKFEPQGKDVLKRKLGVLSVAMEARFLINDGQHRRAAIERALQDNPSLANETISVVFFVDNGLARSQQMFADLNRHAVRATRSLGILYDHRDPMSRLVSKLIKSVPVFKGMTETARSTISNRSRKLFTLSAVYTSTRRLLGKREGEAAGAKEEELAREFWCEVAKHIPDWRAAAERKATPSELRAEYVHAHGIALQALAIAGSDLIVESPKDWKQRLSKLKGIDWSRENATLWEGRALIGGRVTKVQNNVILTANVIKRALGLALTPSEKRVEELYAHGQVSKDA